MGTSASTSSSSAPSTPAEYHTKPLNSSLNSCGAPSQTPTFSIPLLHYGVNGYPGPLASAFPFGIKPEPIYYQQSFQQPQHFQHLHHTQPSMVDIPTALAVSTSSVTPCSSVTVTTSTEALQTTTHIADPEENANGSCNSSAGRISTGDQSVDDDGYRWRKYGRKSVKGNQFPRSYYKCTHKDCHVKKQVEKRLENGRIVVTTTYKGEHTHEPQVTRLNAADQSSFKKSVLAEFMNHQQQPLPAQPHHKPLHPVTPPSPVHITTHSYQPARAVPVAEATVTPAVAMPPAESAAASITAPVAASPPAMSPPITTPPGTNASGNNNNSPRNTVSYTTTYAPRLVIETTADVDHLDDGYHWRKYGQKNVKGSNHPRSYYKCTEPDCPVKKQVEQCGSSIINTYEGTHNHPAPGLVDSPDKRKRRQRKPADPAVQSTATQSIPIAATSSPCPATTVLDFQPAIPALGGSVTGKRKEPPYAGVVTAVPKKRARPNPQPPTPPGSASVLPSQELPTSSGALLHPVASTSKSLPVGVAFLRAATTTTTTTVRSELPTEPPSGPSSIAPRETLNNEECGKNPP